MSPVVKEQGPDGQLSLFHMTEPERKLTLTEVAGYLRTADVENALRAIQ